MASLSQALRLEYLPSSHSAFQGHATHIIKWSMMLRPKDSEGTCIPSGVTTFLHAASRRSLRSDYYGQFDCLQGLGAFGTGLPCLLPTLLRIPCRLSRVHSGERKRDAVGGVFLNVPSTLCGSLVVIWGRSGLPISPVESAMFSLSSGLLRCLRITVSD
jgi:hypothetical protein